MNSNEGYDTSNRPYPAYKNLPEDCICNDVKQEIHLEYSTLVDARRPLSVGQ